MITFDSHTHLNLEEFENDAEKILEKTLQENVWMINVGANKKSSLQAIKLAENKKEGVYASVGIHPISLFPAIEEKLKRETEIFDFEFYSNLAKDEKVVAIGEVGLDYHHFEKGHNLDEIKKLQKKVLKNFLEIAWQNDNALIIHCWEAYDDLLEILTQFIEEKKWTKKEKGIIHSFIGNLKTAEKFLDLGFLIGLNGIITYSNSYDKLIKNLPIEKIVIETDAPYLTPKPLLRTERNEPVNVKLVAEKIAEIRNSTFEEISGQTTRNALRVFGI